MRWIAYVVLAGCWTGSPPPSAPIANTAPEPTVERAPPPEVAPTTGSEERARELFASGEKHYNLGQFVDAAQDFEAAYNEVPNYVLLYNVAQAYRQAGDHQQALANYQRFLTEGGAKIRQSIRDVVNDEIQKLSPP